MKRKKLLFLSFSCCLLFGYVYNANLVTQLKEKNDEQKVLIDELNVHIENLSNKTFNREEMFQIAAQVYDIDFKLLYAIAKHETGHFKSSLFINNNNPGGIKDFESESGWASFDTEFEGIMEMARLIRKYYYDYGLDTVEKIGAKYCPGSDTWARDVRILMGKI